MQNWLRLKAAAKEQLCLQNMLFKTWAGINVISVSHSGLYWSLYCQSLLSIRLFRKDRSFSCHLQRSHKDKLMQSFLLQTQACMIHIITTISGVRVFSTITHKLWNYTIKLIILHHENSFNGQFCKIKTFLNAMWDSH